MYSTIIRVVTALFSYIKAHNREKKLKRKLKKKN